MTFYQKNYVHIILVQNIFGKLTDPLANIIMINHDFVVKDHDLDDDNTMWLVFRNLSRFGKYLH